MSSEPTEGRTVRVPPLWLVLLLTALVFAIGAFWKIGCGPPYEQLCYNDIFPLYSGRGLFNGVRVYLDAYDGRYLEYPVLTGVVLQVAGWITGSGGDLMEKSHTFVAVTALLLLPFALATTAAMWHTEPGTRIHPPSWASFDRRTPKRSSIDRRSRWRGAAAVGAVGAVGAVRERVGPRAALMVAVAPVLLLDGTINWDLVAVAFTALAMWAWSRDAPLWTGIFLGLGASAKLYPLFILGPLLVLCVRDRRWQAVLRAVAGTAGAWLIANLPVMLLNFQGWKEFYTFSQTRGIDFGSIWLAWSNFGHPFIDSSTANTGSAALFLVGCLAVAVLAWLCPAARLAQLAFLVIAVFVLVNKVYSPQYALWLLPLAALARPRWPAFLLWQLGEVVYFVAIWRFLSGYGQVIVPDGAISTSAYTWAIVLHVGLTAMFGALIVVDAVRESRQVQTIASARVVV